jgi:heavy metal sensor kinase
VAKFPRALKKTRETAVFTRGLRFRLAAGFLLFFTILLLGLGVVFRQMLLRITNGQVAALLEEEWAASKGYLHFEHQRPIWQYDRFDPEEAIIVDRIQAGGVYLLVDEHGIILERSEPAVALGLATTESVKNLIREARKTTPMVVEMKHGKQTYMLHFGLVPDKEHHLYLLLLGRALTDATHVVDQFTLGYFAIVPLIVLLCAALGWALAGRGLKPVMDVARAAQRITGSNLNVKIPTRGAGDELDHMIRAFNRMIERLNYSFEQIRQFSTDVSHELRTPLTAIRGQLEVALFTAETPEQYRDAMVNALQDVEQLSNIVRALLLLSQAESGQVVLQMSTLNLAEVVRDMVDQYQIPAEDAHVSLTAEVPDELFVRGDRTQLGRLLSNLLSNAMKYTPRGGKIVVGLQAVDGSAQLWVEDNGIGIPAEKLPHIFDRFYRVRPSESNPVQGLGLGLSFVSWIVNAHGGKIEVDSTEHKGTRFTVTVPLGEQGSEAESKPAEAVAEHASGDRS